MKTIENVSETAERDSRCPHYYFDTMKKIAFLILAFVIALPLAAETWKSVTLMDGDCAAKPARIAKADEHQRMCAMKCAITSGYGAVVDGKFLKFDAKGNKLAKAALEKTDKKDHLRATVQGDLKDGVIHVSSLTLE